MSSPFVPVWGLHVIEVSSTLLFHDPYLVRRLHDAL